MTTLRAARLGPFPASRRLTTSSSSAAEERAVQFEMRKSAISALGLAILLLSACSAPPATSFVAAAIAQETFPDANALVHAGSDADDWILPGKTYSNNRYTSLPQITPQNVHKLSKAWSTALADNGEQEASPIVWHGTMYVTTPHESILALDAATGAVKWQFPYNPSYVRLFAVNQGVGIEDGKLFLATQDCRVIAIDATTGKQVWNVNGCPSDQYTSTINTWFHLSAYVYGHQIILGTSGGDNGNIGHVLAFSTTDGHRLWDWHAIPFPGEPGHDTWPGNSWEHGGGDVWGGVTIDPATQTVFVSTGNPGPDMVDAGRKGANLYTDSVVALDISGPKPRMKWYYQMIPDDTHDADMTMPPILFEGTVHGVKRLLLADADKGGNFAVLDRTNGKVVYRFALDSQKGMWDTKPSLTGTVACPDHHGGVLWNGFSYDPATNFAVVPNTEECGFWKIPSLHPQYIPGQPYEGGPLPPRQNATGKLTAIDISSGRIAWITRVPDPLEGGDLVTHSGLVFTNDLAGHLYAVNDRTGKILWSAGTGASIVAPITAYGVDGNEYIVVMSGSAAAQQAPNVPVARHSVITAYRLGPIASPIANTTAGQVAVAAPTPASGALAAGTGAAPYTPAQVAAGEQLYQQRCSACHGASLQGVSAPALTGANFGSDKLNLAQVRTIVTTTMPLTAPGSLQPGQYASILAYLLSYDCVPAQNHGTQPMPTTSEAAFQNIKFGSRSCRPKQ
jgi:alcohol dehydrogenase (cytochrome c)